MAKISLYDSLGNELDHLTQWDVNQYLCIEGAMLAPIPEAHFCNVDSESTISVTPTVVDGKIKALIPNELLQQRFTIRAYLYYELEAGAFRTMFDIQLPITPRKRPQNVSV